MRLRAGVNLFAVIVLAAAIVFFVRRYREHRELTRESGRVLMMGWNGHNYGQVLKATRDGDIGGIVIFASAATSGAELQSRIRELRKASPWRLILAVDAEGGQADRLGELAGYGTTATAWVMGHADPTFTEAEAGKMARALKSFDIDLDLAPVTDLAVNPRSPVIALRQRSFSANPETVVAHARAFLRALAKSGVRGTLKHFPGHGSAMQDSHLSLPDISRTWSATELQPYRKLIGDTAVGAVMTAHLLNSNWDPEFPASLSVAVVQGLLRGELGYQGLVITDDLQMGAVRRKWDVSTRLRLALNAGNDLLLFAEQFRNDDMAQLHNELSRQVESGAIPRAKLDAAYERVLEFTAR